MPEKSGIDAALCAPGLAGAAVGANCCAEATVIAATVASNRKCRCIFMSTSPSWPTQDARPRAVAVPSILYQKSEPAGCRPLYRRGSCELGGVAATTRRRAPPAGCAEPLCKALFSLAKKGVFRFAQMVGPLCREHDACRNVGFN